MYDDHPFCCTGCSFVYEILRDNDACEYYDIEKHPGVRIRKTEIGNKYAYLDNEEIIEKLLAFSDGGISRTSFFIPSIHCSSCIWLLENLGRFNENILNSSVNFIKKKISLTYKSEKISLREIVELLVSLNYIPRISLSDIKDEGKPVKSNKHLYYQIGVAAFCFGNIMLLSMPEYLAFNYEVEQDFKQVFSWIIFGLSLPVLFYADRDYLISAYKGLRKKIINIDVPITLGIITLFTRSTWEIITQTGPGYMDSLSGLVFFLLIGKWYQNKTYQALSFERDYKSYFPIAVTVLKEDTEEFIPLNRIKTGSRLLIRNNELIPADAILAFGVGNIDYSFVSGESTPFSKQKGERIFAGGRQMGSAIEVVVEKEVAQSYLTGLWNQEFEKRNESGNLKSIINVVSQYFTIVIIVIALITGITWLILDPDIALNAFTSVLIVACPCALALTIPFTFGSAMRIFGRGGFYLKNVEAIENLTRINTIVFDKTGTITQSNKHRVEFIGNLSKNDLMLIKSAVRQSTHPLSIAIYNSINESSAEEPEVFNEFPGLGIACKINGMNIKIGAEKFVKDDDSLTESLASLVFVSFNDQVIGHFKISNEYRPGLKENISRLGKKYELHLLTGDNESERANLEKIFSGFTRNLHFRQSPKDKLHYIENLKLQGKNILMIGDGLNDAGALSKSNVGISIADDIYHFSPACDAILEAGKFHNLYKLLGFTRKSMNIVKVSFVISFLYNVIGIFFAAKGLLSPIIAAILMPVSSVTVVAFVTLATVLAGRRMKI